MGDQGLEQQTNESQDAYKIISFPGAILPETYKALVFSRFLRSLRFGNDYFKLIDSDSYYSVYHNYIHMLLNRPKTQIKFAVLSDDHENVLGFAIIEPGKLHYCHVHKDYRRSGIGSFLCSEPFQVITHITHIGASIWNNKFPKVRFNPFS